MDTRNLCHFSPLLGMASLSIKKKPSFLFLLSLSLSLSILCFLLSHIRLTVLSIENLYILARVLDAMCFAVAFSI